MNRYTNIFILFVIVQFVVAGISRLNAQDTHNLGELTLEDCIQIAQEQSPEAESARYSLIASRWNYRSYRANLLPGLELSGNAPNYQKSIFSNRLDDGTIVYQSQVQSDANTRLALSQNVALTGGNISVSTGIQRLGIFAGENSYLWGSTPLVVGLQQPLFQFNRLKWRTRIEPLQYEIAQKQYIQNMEEIAQRATEFFFEVYLAQVNLENARFNVERNDSIYTINNTRFDVGDIAETDLLQSELELKNAKARLNNARINYDRVLGEFKVFLGYDKDVVMDLESPGEPPVITPRVDRAVQLALENNNEALRYQLQELVADRDYAQAKSQSNLQMTLSANYGLNQSSENFADLYNDPENSQFLTVGFQIPIFNWGQFQAEIKAAKNQQRETDNSITYQRKQFVQEIEYQVNEFLQLRNQVLLAAQSDTIALRRYEVAQTLYLVGDIDITTLFIAQRQKDDAREAYIRELRRFWVGLYNLRSLTLFNFRENRPIQHEM